MILRLYFLCSARNTVATLLIIKKVYIFNSLSHKLVLKIFPLNKFCLFNTISSLYIYLKKNKKSANISNILSLFKIENILYDNDLNQINSLACGIGIL